MLDENRWANLIGRLGFRENGETFIYLSWAYQEPPVRFYHNSNHINQCLQELTAEVRKLSKYPNELEVALWFHDCVYDPKRLDNEIESAKRAKCFLAGHLHESQIYQEEDVLPVLNRVQNLIRITEHVCQPACNDEALIMDIDLSIFGQAPEAFDLYEENIRKEYYWVPEEIFRERRSDFLRSILNRRKWFLFQRGREINNSYEPIIYWTGYFETKYGVQARENIRRSLAKLETK
jgi:predicted metal-dependent HD superfamily phosphohydrolase